MNQKFYTALLGLLAISQTQILSQACIFSSYPFNGDASDTVSMYDGDIYGALPTFDRFGDSSSAYLFDGISNYIDTKASFDFQHRTVSVWAKARTLSQNARIIDQDAASLTYGALGLNVLTDGSVYANAGGNVALMTSKIHTGEWYHFALVRDGDTNRVYLNAQLEFTNLSSGNGSITQPNPELVIGAFRAKNANFFDGAIDDLVVFHCALSQSEIADIYHQHPIGIDNPKQEIKVSVFPNPTTENFIITLGKSNRLVSTVQLIDMTGRIIQTISTKGESSVILPRGTVAPGIYQVVCTNDEQVLGTSSVVIQ